MKTKLVIFGITGDLSTRKLLPALRRIVNTGDFDDLSVIGVSRHQVNLEELLVGYEQQLAGRTSMFTMDLTQAADYAGLREYISLQPDEQVIFYLSVPPTSSVEIVEHLGEAGLNTDNVKLMLEKPFGIDLVSARDMIDHVGKYYHESQIYRIDHYLAKEMAQNILIFRAGNAIFNNIWDNRFIEKIEVVAFEKIGIEGRAHFYEQTGALRDVVQGHMMQLLSLTIMDIPDDEHYSETPAKRLEAVRKIQPADPTLAFRGQYNEYRDEVQNPDSTVETFVSLQLSSDAEKWRGVPLVLTTGKALSEKRTEVRIHFRRQREDQANCLIFSIQPNEGVELDVYARHPGYNRSYEQKKLRFDYTQEGHLHDAYEQVIVDAIRSHKSLFASGEEVLRSWEILQPVQQAWAAGTSRLITYAQNTPATEIVSN